MHGAAARITAAALALVALGLCASAGAQQVRLEPNPAIDCLAPPAAERGAPDYPFVQYKDGSPGRVAVALSFSSPGTRPAVTVLSQQGDAAFVEAVQAHVSSFRLPCHDGGERPVRLNFEFIFRADNRRAYPQPPVDADEAARRAQLACMVHASGAKAPDYPLAARRSGLQGRVLARLRFDTPDQPPVAEVLTYLPAGAAGQRQRAIAVLAEPIKDWVSGYRLPCLQGGPVSASITFVYRLEGEAFGFRPGMTLMSLLPMVRGIRQQRLALDTSTMACPFDVELTYRRPHLRNAVAEVGSTDAARQPLLDWLQGVELDLPPHGLASVFGDSAQVHVPCLTLDLKPEAG